MVLFIQLFSSFLLLGHRRRHLPRRIPKVDVAGRPVRRRDHGGGREQSATRRFDHHLREKRPDAVRAVMAWTVTAEGVAVRCWTVRGNTRRHPSIRAAQLDAHGRHAVRPSRAHPALWRTLSPLPAAATAGPCALGAPPTPCSSPSCSGGAPGRPTTRARGRHGSNHWPYGSISRAASGGPQDPRGYRCRGSGSCRIGSTTFQAASTPASPAKREGKPSMASPRRRS